MKPKAISNINENNQWRKHEKRNERKWRKESRESDMKILIMRKMTIMMTII